MVFRATLFLTVHPNGDDNMTSQLRTTGEWSDIGLGLVMSMATNADFEIIVRSAVDMLNSDKGTALIKELRKS